MDLRLKKQLIVAVIFFIFLGTSGYGLFTYIVPPKPSPTPDPTANLTPLQIRESVLIPVDEESLDYDFVAYIENKNPNYGAKQFDYKIDFIGQDNQILETKTGKSYLMPGASRYIIESPLRFSAKLSDARFQIIRTEWSQLDPLFGNNIQLTLLNRPVFEQREIPGIFGVVAGTIKNNSQFNVDDIDIAVVLEASNGEIIGVGKTSLNTFIAQTTRGFETRWFFPLLSEPTGVKTFVYTNLFDLENIIRSKNNTTSEKFQQTQ